MMLRTGSSVARVFTLKEVTNTLRVNSDEMPHKPNI